MFGRIDVQHHGVVRGDVGGVVGRAEEGGAGGVEGFGD